MTNPNKPDALDLESFGGHTEGCWSVCEHSWSDTSVMSSGDVVASLSIMDEATEENQDDLERIMDSNARLIAAAPQLLSELRTERAKTEKLEAENKALREALIQANRHVAEAMGWNWLDTETRPPGEDHMESELERRRDLLSKIEDQSK